jgi:hypothetical protein
MRHSILISLAEVLLFENCLSVCKIDIWEIFLYVFMRKKVLHNMEALTGQKNDIMQKT